MKDFNKLALRAVDLQNSKDYEASKKIYLSLLKLQPNNKQILRLLALVEYELKNYKISLKLLENCLNLDKHNTEAILNKAMVLTKIKNFKEAEGIYLELFKKEKKNLNILFNYANLLKETKRYKEAQGLYKKVIEIDKNFSKAFLNLGYVNNLIGNKKESIKNLDAAIKINPNYAEAIFYKSILQLELGNYKDGFKNYEWRFDIKTNRAEKRNFKQQIWNGEDLREKTILLHGEQGLGDQIQFIRFAKIVEKYSSNIIIEVHNDLVQLFKETTNFKNIFGKGDKLPDFDFHCPFMSLPLKLKVSADTIPAYKNYLDYNDNRLKKWEIFFKSKKFKIGINWQGSNNPTFDEGRSFKVSEFKNISKIENLELFSLQKVHGLENLKDFANKNNFKFFKNFDDEFPFVDTAAIINYMDLIITSDTSVAHLAGALGKKTFLVLQKNCEWRWALDDKYSPWYPSIIIYKQKKQNDWKAVFDTIKNDIITKYF